MNSLEFFICSLLVVFSFFLSGSEIALLSLSRFQLKSLRDKHRKTFKKVKTLLQDPSGLLITILVLNEVINISLSTLIATYLQRHPPEGIQSWLKGFIHEEIWVEIMAGIIFTSPILLLLCEITPKAIGARANQLLAPYVGPSLYWIYKIFDPVRRVLQEFLRTLNRIFRSSNPKFENAENYLREEDFLAMVEEAHQEGNVQTTELELIRNVFDLDDTQIHEIYTPLSRVVSLSDTLNLESTIKKLIDGNQPEQFSRIPVYRKNNKADIIGILYTKDLLIAKLEKDDPQTPIQHYLWKPMTVSYQSKLHTVFKRMKKQKTHFSLVLNEQGVVMGIVTLNDILGALLSELSLEDEEGVSL